MWKICLPESTRSIRCNDIPESLICCLILQKSLDLHIGTFRVHQASDCLKRLVTLMSLRTREPFEPIFCENNYTRNIWTVTYTL